MKIKLPEELANKKINLVAEEPFFKSPEGEAIWAGKTCMWMRATGCSLSCAWKNNDGSVSLCDTPFSSHIPSSYVVTVQEAYDRLMDGDHNYVSISGGEPTVQPVIFELINFLEESGKQVKFESNGTAFIPSKASMACISPKLGTSAIGLLSLADPTFFDQDNNNFLKTEDFAARAERYKKLYERHERKRYNPEVLKQIMNHYGPDDYIFKFVVNTEEDMKEINEKYVEALNIPSKNVWLMPQGISSEHLQAKAAWVIELCKKYNYNYTDRLHIRIYGNKIGV